jgi:ribosomal protein S18 acetylase RimI-like enzyme
MEIKYDTATKDDINELIRLRIAYMMDDFGSVSENERIALEKQLPDYFSRKLGSELIAFVARDEEKIVSVAYLLIIEMPANLLLLNGRYGDVLNVYTEPEYRGKGLATRLMNNLIEYGKKAGLGRIDLLATGDGYPIYKKVGFEDKKQKYKDMVYKIK